MKYAILFSVIITIVLQISCESNKRGEIEKRTFLSKLNIPDSIYRVTSCKEINNTLNIKHVSMAYFANISSEYYDKIYYCYNINDEIIALEIYSNTFRTKREADILFLKLTRVFIDSGVNVTEPLIKYNNLYSSIINSDFEKIEIRVQNNTGDSLWCCQLSIIY